MQDTCVLLFTDFRVLLNSGSIQLPYASLLPPSFYITPSLKEFTVTREGFLGMKQCLQEKSL